MNCKPGELAIIVKAMDSFERQHVGKIVRVLKIKECGHWDYEAPYLFSVIGPFGCLCVCLDDSQLRPIRDNDGKDETLGWAPSPEKLTA